MSQPVGEGLDGRVFDWLGRGHFIVVVERLFGSTLPRKVGD